MKQYIRYTGFASPLGRVWIFAGPRGISGVCLTKEAFRSRLRELAARYGRTPANDPRGLKPLSRELEAYLLGEIPRPRLSADLESLTPFQRRVLETLSRIPYGSVRSYAWVAAASGKSRASRAVGRACAANPVPLLIPCHRVVAKNGAPGGFSAGPKIKQWLLDLEATHVERLGPASVHGWKSP